MSLEAVWAAKFYSDGGVPFNAGAGVIIFDSDRIYGGDSFMYYVGKYKIESGIISGSVDVDTHTDGATSVIGNVRKFTVEFKGLVNEKEMTLTGAVTAPVNAKVVVNLRRIYQL